MHFASTYGIGLSRVTSLLIFYFIFKLKRVSANSYGSTYRFSSTDGVAWSSSAHLLAADNVEDDEFGSSVASHKNFAVVGDYSQSSNNGGAYVFSTENSGRTWSTQAKLMAPEDVEGSSFGYQVAISEYSILVTAPQYNTHRGAAYSFSLHDDTNSWELDATLIPTQHVKGYFGSSISLHETSLLIGATEINLGAGSVSVYNSKLSSETVWSLETELRANDGEVNDCFGFSVAHYGYNAVVGTVDTGSVYVFSKILPNSNNNRVWSQVSKLVITTEYMYAKPTTSVALFGNTALIGLYYQESYEISGSAYIYSSIGAGTLATWSQQSRMVPKYRDDGYGFGKAVSIYSNLVAVSSLQSQTDGLVYIFSNPSSTLTWTLQSILSHPTSDHDNDHDDSQSSSSSSNTNVKEATIQGFGTSVSIKASELFVGCVPAHDTRIVVSKTSRYGSAYSTKNEVIALASSLLLGFLFTMGIGIAVVRPDLFRNIIDRMNGKVVDIDEEEAMPTVSEQKDLMAAESASGHVEINTYNNRYTDNFNRTMEGMNSSPMSLPLPSQVPLPLHSQPPPSWQNIPASASAAQQQQSQQMMRPQQHSQSPQMQPYQMQQTPPQSQSQSHAQQAMSQQMMSQQMMTGTGTGGPTHQTQTRMSSAQIQSQQHMSQPQQQMSQSQQQMYQPQQQMSQSQQQTMGSQLSPQSSPSQMAAIKSVVEDRITTKDIKTPTLSVKKSVPAPDSIDKSAHTVDDVSVRMSKSGVYMLT
eukprot:gene3180-6275_t